MTKIKIIFSILLSITIVSIVSYLFFEKYSYIENKLQIKFTKQTNLTYDPLFRSDHNKNSHLNPLFEPNQCSIFNKNAKQFSVTIDGVTYPKYIPLYHNNSYNFTCMNQDNSSKVILLWTKYFGDSIYSYGLGKSEPFIKHRCPVTNCEITNDRNRLNDSDLIIIHMRENIERLPETRKPNQRWVFLLFESPIHSSDFSQYNGLFNLSATYKRTSDFSSIYYVESFIKWNENKDYDINKNFMTGKIEFAAALISNCNTFTSKRLEYLNELKNYVSVQIYGNCGTSCPTTLGNGTNADCKNILGLKYKFYLAFENSICEDYITEKFFHILRYDIIPVVYGGGPYDYHIPKSGYINAFDFNSPKELADYLLYLDSNVTAYNSYFKWKKYFYIDNQDPHEGHLCEMCIRLNIDRYVGIKNSVIEDFSSFWSLKKDCKMVDRIANISLLPF